MSRSLPMVVIVLCGTLVGMLFPTGSAVAGMPSVQFHEIAKLRLEVISFFGVVLLVSAGVVQRLWNGLRRDFTRLPHLSYWRATSIVVLWGLLFTVVLTMISGARELMTPGAWEKDGLLYKLPSPTSDSPPAQATSDSTAPENTAPENTTPEYGESP